MKHILVATDFSKSSQHAVDCAAQIALQTDAKLLIFHSTHIPVISDSFFDVGVTMDALEEADKDSMKALIAVLRDRYRTLKIESLVKIGFTGEMLKKLTRNGEIGMVVMGITHYDKFSETLFGSTSTAVAGDLSCPVLIIPEKWKFKPFSRIAFAFDQKPIPLGTGIKTLASLVKRYGSKVDFVNVMDENFPVKDDSSLKKAIDILKLESPKIHFIKPLKYKLVDQLKDFTKRYKNNMLVMISRDHSILWKLLNERRTKKMAFESNVPILVLAEK